MKVKTGKHTYEITKIIEDTPKSFVGYWNNYYIDVKKEKRDHTYYIMCAHPDGCYIYDGYFHGTRLEALKDVFKNIEIE